MSYDRVRVGLFTDLFAAIAEEMGSVLERASFSQNIKERRDYSCAVFDEQGQLIAQAAHIPVHLGAMEFLMKRWLADGPTVEPNREYITNDPFFAGTHLPDISILRSVESGKKRIGFVACRAHHADVGGETPGSISPSKDVYGEGVIIKPQQLTPELQEWFVSRTRGREERLGDLRAQTAAATIGAARLQRLAQRYGNELKTRIAESLDYAEELTRAVIEKIPKGEYCAEDGLEDVPGGAKIKLKITVAGTKITFDFAGTDPQRPIGINATEAVTRSACYYVVRCLAPGAPSNGGCWRGVEVLAPEGSLVNATHPAAVVAGNTETSQRIVDVALQALAKALPRAIPACSQGTMNNVAFGSDTWAYYETIGGGAGAGPYRNGASGVHTHMTNTRNTPCEALEIELPLRLRRYELRDGSGGNGLHAGGMGIVREFEALEAMTFSHMGDRRMQGPPGAAGGGAGGSGRTVVNGELMPSKGSLELAAGDRILIESPGGGGWFAE